MAMNGKHTISTLAELEALFPDGSKLLTIHRPIK